MLLKNLKDRQPQFSNDYPVMMWSVKYDEWIPVIGRDIDMDNITVYINDNANVIKRDADFTLWFSLPKIKNETKK